MGEGWIEGLLEGGKDLVGAIVPSEGAALACFEGATDGATVNSVGHLPHVSGQASPIIRPLFRSVSSQYTFFLLSFLDNHSQVPVRSLFLVNS
jgi:hypothetical protein